MRAPVSRWLSVTVTVVDKMHDESGGHVGSGEAVEGCERKMEAGPELGRRWEVLVGAHRTPQKWEGGDTRQASSVPLLLCSEGFKILLSLASDSDVLLLLVERKWQTPKEEKETEKQEKYCRSFGKWAGGH